MARGSFTTGGPGARIGKAVPANKITTSVVNVAQDHYNAGVLGKSKLKHARKKRRAKKR